MLQNEIKEGMNFVRHTLASLRKSTLKQIVVLVNDFILEDDNTIYLQWYLAVIDTIESKIYKPPPLKPSKQKPSSIIKIQFLNKGIEMINVPRLLHSPSLASTFPKQAGCYKAPTVVYKLEDTIRSSIFNFNHFVKTLDLDKFMEDNTILPCNCGKSPFIDNHHNHVITGDLRIVPNNKLRKLFVKGPKHREPVTIDFLKSKEEIIEGMEVVINRWSDTSGVDEVVFEDWKHEFHRLLDDRISNITRNIKIQKTLPSLKQYHVKNALKELQKNYIITPIDKASGNSAFICKRFYAEILVQELGLKQDINTRSTPDKTYAKVNNIDNKEIIKQHKKDLMDLFNITVSLENEVLPTMYWLPKKHKVPTKARFIVAAVRCSIKPLAKCLTSILKLFYKQIENYNLKSHYFSGIKTFWVIQDKQPAVKAIHSLNTRNKARSIMTFDFSTLYTKIPHDKLIFVLNELTDFCFKGCPSSKIKVDHLGAFWIGEDSRKDKHPTFSKDQVKAAIAYVLSNCFFNIGDQLFRQTIGIPMGLDPAPFMANLFLYYYESKYLKQLKKISLGRARKFGNVFRFIDDLSAINDGGEFEKGFKDIYPEELELKRENIGILEASFLDLEITIINKQFRLKLYDKRDAFPFTIIRMPYLSNNMPSRIFYSTIGSELLRIARCTTEKVDFVDSAIKLVTRMYAQGAVFAKTKNTINKIYGKHHMTFSNFFDTSLDLARTILWGDTSGNLCL